MKISTDTHKWLNQQRIIWKLEKYIKEMFEAVNVEDVNVETMQSNTTVSGDFNGSIV